MPGERPVGLPQRPGGQPYGCPGFGLSHADQPQSAPRVAPRRRRLRGGGHSRNPVRSLEVSRHQALRRSPEGKPGQGGHSGHRHGRVRQTRAARHHRRGARLWLSRRIARLGGRRSHRQRHDGGRRATDAFRDFHHVRRRANAGRHVRLDANAAHHRRRQTSPRGQAPLHCCAYKSDHRRRNGLVWNARRRAHRRARGGRRFRRRPRHRADNSRAPAGGLPAGGIPARARNGRYGRAAAATARDPRPIVAGCYRGRRLMRSRK